MVITLPDGTTKTFQGERGITSLLTGVKSYMEGEKKKWFTYQNAKAKDAQ
jgi:hypothetical protein